MALEGQQCVVLHHAGAVVGQADQLASPGFNVEAKISGAGVERIFQQLFYDARRTLHNLTGGNFVGDVVGKNANAAHGKRG